MATLGTDIFFSNKQKYFTNNFTKHLLVRALGSSRDTVCQVPHHTLTRTGVLAHPRVCSCPR